jgi:hypothetical protein
LGTRHRRKTLPAQNVICIDRIGRGDADGAANSMAHNPELPQCKKPS